MALSYNRVARETTIALREERIKDALRIAISEIRRDTYSVPSDILGMQLYRELAEKTWNSVLEGVAKREYRTAAEIFKKYLFVRNAETRTGKTQTYSELLFLVDTECISLVRNGEIEKASELRKAFRTADIRSEIDVGLVRVLDESNIGDRIRLQPGTILINRGSRVVIPEYEELEVVDLHKHASELARDTNKGDEARIELFVSFINSWFVYGKIKSESGSLTENIERKRGVCIEMAAALFVLLDIEGFNNKSYIVGMQGFFEERKDGNIVQKIGGGHTWLEVVVDGKTFIADPTANIFQESAGDFTLVTNREFIITYDSRQRNKRHQ